MAWERNKLTELQVRSKKPDSKLRKLSDGRGLQFWITPQGGRYWRWEYRYLGKKKLLAFGIYPDVTMAQARRLADEARSLLAMGQDPSEVRRRERLARSDALENLFSRVAERLVDEKRRDGRAEVTISKIKWILGKVRPQLAHRPINEIKTPEIVRVLAKEKDAGNFETARRMRMVLGEVFRYAIQHGLTESDPVQATRVKRGTKSATTSSRVKHHPAILQPEQLGEMLRAIDAYAANNVLTGSALQLMALLYPRPGELRQAKWEEFDLTQATWEIPAERMKMREKHTKALPRQAVTILKRLRDITGPDGYIFPAVGKANRCMSENTMGKALERMGIKPSDHVPHGFRSTASTLLNASNLFSSDAVERSLAHQDKDSVRRAYARGDAMTERMKMSQWWADRLDTIRDGKLGEVIALSSRMR